MEKDGFSLLMEVDYLFNFLYHDHPELPTKGINKVIKQTDSQRATKIKRYFAEMSLHYEIDPQPWRKDRTVLFRKYLSPSNIDHLTKTKLKELCNSFHCMNSYPLNRTRFQNPQNNKLVDIINEWKQLLHSGKISSSKIQKVNDSLRFFGPSAIQELIAWYYPYDYPMMNANSDCGMRFFGYDV